MTDRIYRLLELAVIRAMPGYWQGMESWMYKTEPWADSEHNILDGEIFHIERLILDFSWSPEDDAKLAVMRRLADFRDGNVRTDVPERRQHYDHYDWPCPVVLDLAEFRPEPEYDPEDYYGDIPF